MLAHGFKIELLVELVRVGLATASTERMLASGRPIEITRLKITGAGPAGACGGSMALILKRASAYAYGTSGTMTITTASPTGRGWPHHEGCGSGAAATQ